MNNSIQKESKELKELIEENKKLIEKYPDDDALKLNLKSLMKRKELTEEK